MKLAIALSALVTSASAFSIASQGGRQSTALFNLEKGAGGMFDTRNPDALVHEDARKSISEAPSFEEYMKMRSGGAAAAPAPAPAAAAPGECQVASEMIGDVLLCSTETAIPAPDP